MAPEEESTPSDHVSEITIDPTVCLRELSCDAGLPQGIRSYAKSLLRHYPSSAEVFSLGRQEDCLASDADDDEYRRRVIAHHQPLLCSSQEQNR